MIAEAAAAIEAGELVVLPTDTVYGLCSSPREEAVRRLYELKRRPPEQPTAILFGDVGTLLENLPELRGRPAGIAGVLLPGPYTLIVPNPARRFPWLNRPRPDAIGVRVPMPSAPGIAVLERVDSLVATSANLPGGPEPRLLDEVPEEIKAGCAVVLEGGELPGLPSTVIDVTGPEPIVLREGAVPAGQALARVAAAVAPPE